MNMGQATGPANLAVGVNEVNDQNNLSDLEKKHLPVIEAPEQVNAGERFEVTVAVGKLLAHPNEHDHFIQFVELYADDTFLARVDFASAKACPKVTFCVSLRDAVEELRAYEHCNIHGTWVGRKPLSVAV